MSVVCRAFVVHGTAGTGAGNGWISPSHRFEPGETWRYILFSCTVLCLCLCTRHNHGSPPGDLPPGPHCSRATHSCLAHAVDQGPSPSSRHASFVFCLPLARRSPSPPSPRPPTSSSACRPRARRCHSGDSGRCPRRYPGRCFTRCDPRRRPNPVRAPRGAARSTAVTGDGGCPFVSRHGCEPG